MKTPRVAPSAFRIVVRPPQGATATLKTSAPLSDFEAEAIARAVQPWFVHYADQYDSKKYWPDVYDRVLEQFRRPINVVPGTLREALLWKYGHLGKPAIPPTHERLIFQIQEGWYRLVAGLPKGPDEAFMALDRSFGGRTRFITVAFLLHLLQPLEVPIIDQHNFRAVNALIRAARPGWRSRKKPSRYEDLVLVATFMEAILAVWKRRNPESAPTSRELDKFLMMYGKAIKRLP